MTNPPFKLFKFPSRGRPERFFKSLDSLVNNINDKNFYHVSCTLDRDDPLMNNPEIIEKINTYPNTSIEWGISKSKIDAINRSMPKIDWDILVCVSDDTIFNLYGFDTCIGIDMLNFFPDLDGLLHYPDQDAKEYLATLYVAGRKWWEFRSGNIYHPSYKSLWCDNEEQMVAQKFGKYKFIGYQINLHMNPAYGHLSRDEMFEVQQGHWEEDERNFHEREANNFGYKEDQIF